MVNKPEKEMDPISGVETTGHEWDGLKELNNPAPRWWLWVFIITIIWAVGYWVVYPAWPTLSGNTKGTAGWTKYQHLKEQQHEIALRQAKYLDRFRTASLETITNDPELFQFALAGGEAAFKQHCTTCHGTGGAGAKGYPNLNDDDWLWGGKLEDIYHTIQVGVRSGHPDMRDTQMPAFGRDGILKREEISQVADYVMSLHEHKGDQFPQGKALFEANCVACHNEGGTGNQEMGAPRLSDDIWLYGGDKATIMTTIANSRAGVMPTWAHRLDDATIKELAVYIHSLGGGK